MAKTGRPSKNDSAALAAIADCLHDHPKLTATEAFSEVIKDFTGEHSPDAARKRIVTKFNRNRGALMQAAAERKNPRVIDRTDASGRIGMSAASRSINDILQSASASTKLLADMNRINSPVSQLLRDHTSASQRMSQQLFDELNRINSPVSQMLDELKKTVSPLPRLLSEIDIFDPSRW